MKTVRRSNRQRRVMREPDSVYFDELQMSILNLGFELSAAEKDLLLIQIEEDQNCAQQRGITSCQNKLQLKRGRGTKRSKGPSKRDIEILVGALESIEEEHIYKKRVTEEVRYPNESKAVNQVDLNTEDSSSDGDSSKGIFSIHEGTLIGSQCDAN